MFKKIIGVCFMSLFYASGALAVFQGTYYSDTLEGSMNSNGTVFMQADHTAAICSEDLSQFAYIHTASTGIVVTLSDRPNCTKFSHTVDLSQSVFRLFGDLSQGVIPDIAVMPLGIKTGAFIKRNISQESFYDNQVELFRSISNTFITGELIKITGRVLDSKKQVSFFLKNKNSGKIHAYTYGVRSDGRFDIILPLPSDGGEYLFTVLSSSAGEKVALEKFESILILSKPTIPYHSSHVPMRVSKIPIKQSNDVYRNIFELPNDMWGEVTLYQSSKRYRTQGQVLSFSGNKLSVGEARYVFSGYSLSTPSSLDISPRPTIVSSGIIYLDTIHEINGNKSVTIKKNGKMAQFRFRIPEGLLIEPDYYVSLPNGDIREYSIDKKYISREGYLVTNTLITGSFPIPDKGTYKFEVNQNSGIAYINIPFYTDFTLPIISEDFLLASGENYENTILYAMNSMRKNLGRQGLVSDSELNKIATLKAKDMYTMSRGEQLGVSHTNSKGNDIRFFANYYGVKRNVFGENVAGLNNTHKTAILELQNGLEESPGHKNNMISPLFSRVGIGYFQKDGYSYLVHIFSD